MEASKNSSPNNNNSLTNSSVSETPVKLIKLPKTNISVEKLPPITDDKVKLPVTEPSSPLGMIKLNQREQGLFERCGNNMICLSQKFGQTSS